MSLYTYIVIGRQDVNLHSHWWAALLANDRQMPRIERLWQKNHQFIYIHIKN